MGTKLSPTGTKPPYSSISLPKRNQPPPFFWIFRNIEYFGTNLRIRL
ncbi:hypothetical protein T03_16029 [Trichinella britovi]|uniref:Uncharacterized protein n=1 Tax=Trichinella britovi TaxID=45882 RepID=A0A0V1AY65_TRIBR|nr:hypothetical protein T03_2415 [Trichinella britovi]KRY29593.1 hypothetical protein T03_16029 [Trichinella britovi]